MRKLRRCSARWRKARWLLFNVEFGSPVQTGRAKQHWHRDVIRHGNADVRGCHRKLSIRSLVVVRIVLVLVRTIMVVVCVNLMNQSGGLEQRM